MAVSFSAGGSGFMRSDYMISDAAIPLRVEESMEQADNRGQFSKLLNDIGGAKKTDYSEAPDNNFSVSGASDVSGVSGDIPREIRKLIESVESGEIKLEDIPEEMLTKDMLRELAKLVNMTDQAEQIDLAELIGKPEQPAALPEQEKEQDFSSDPDAQEIMAELAAMLSAQQSAFNPDDKTDELTSLTVQPVETEAVQTEEIKNEPVKLYDSAVEEIPVQEQLSAIPEQTGELNVPQEAEQEVLTAVENVVQPEASDEEQTVYASAAATEYVAPQTEQTDRTQPEKDAQAAQKQVSEVTAEDISAVREIPAAQSGNAEQQSGKSDDGQNGGFEPQTAASNANQAQTDEADAAGQPDYGSIRETISRTEVKSGQKAPETEQTQTEQPEFAQHTAHRGRIVSKSDELQMIKSSAEATVTEKPVDENAAASMAQPQNVTAENPVIFTRADGREVPVKPLEVAQQVADKLIERTENLTEGETEYSVTLNPEDLGRITVKMTKTADGMVSVSIAAENSRTLRIIEDNGTAIQDSLRQNGVQLEHWQTVSESRQEAHAEDYQGSSKNPYRENENSQQEQDSEDESFAEIIASM